MSNSTPPNAPGSAQPAMTKQETWPCPNECGHWCRIFDPREPMTNHHPRCEHVDASLMDVWSVRIPGDKHGCVVDSEAAALVLANEDHDAPLEVVKMKMHREIYENLAEFAGF